MDAKLRLRLQPLVRILPIPNMAGIRTGILSREESPTDSPPAPFFGKLKRIFSTKWNYDPSLPHIPRTHMRLNAEHLAEVCMLVNEETGHGRTTLFTCEFCASTYSEIGLAEDCEQHCGTLGFTSAEIRRKAIHVPKVEIMPLL